MINGDKKQQIICKICNRKCMNSRSLMIHVARKHNITSQEYYDRFLKNDSEGICPVCKNKTNYRGINRGYNKFCSHGCRNTAYPNKNCIVSDYTRNLLSQKLKGRKKSKEEIRHLSEALKGRKSPMKGKHHTEETKIKMSQSKIGKKMSTKIIEKMKITFGGKNNPMYGKHHSEETKKKISKKQKDAWANGTNKIPNRFASSWEDTFYEILKEHFSENEIKRQFRIKGLSHPFDFAISSHKVLVEIDSNYWHSSEEAKTRDTKINRFVEKTDWGLLRIKEKELRDFKII